MPKVKVVTAGVFLLFSAMSLCWAGEEAHSGPNKPILIKPQNYEAAKPSAQSEKGRQLYESAHCNACHSLNNEGGFVGPLLDGIGARRNTDFLIAKLTDTEAAKQKYANITGQSVAAQVPHVRVPQEMSRSIIAYLETIPEPRGGFAVFSHNAAGSDIHTSIANYKPEPPSQSSEEGKQLYNKFGCAACHEIQHAGGHIGPTLDGIGRFRSSDYIENHITDAQVQAVAQDKFFELVPTSMPKFNATAAEIKKIRDYILTLPADK